MEVFAIESDQGLVVDATSNGHSVLKTTDKEKEFDEKLRAYIIELVKDFHHRYGSQTTTIHILETDK